MSMGTTVTGKSACTCGNQQDNNQQPAQHTAFTATWLQQWSCSVLQRDRCLPVVGRGGRTMIMSPAHRKLFVYGCCLPLRIIFRAGMPARPPLSSIGIAAVITQQIGRSHGDQTQLQRMRRTGTERKTRNKREERGVAGTGRREGGKGPPVWATGQSRTSYPESQNFSHFAFSFCRLPPQQA